MRANVSRLPRRRLAWTGMVLLACAGCGSDAPPAADPAAARAALVSALDAWKRGDRPDALGQGQPPIQVSDWRWLSGAKLVRYEVAERNRPVGADLRCPVRLWVDLGRGKPTLEVAEYNVGTGRVLTVSRSGDR